MKTFKDLKFKEHNLKTNVANVAFDNGYMVGVIKIAEADKKGNGLFVCFIGKKDNAGSDTWQQTNRMILTKHEVTALMKEVQKRENLK